MSAENAEAIALVSSTKTEEKKEVHNAPSVTSSVEPAKSEKFGSLSTMADLKERAPEVYRAMMQGIGLNICREMQKHQKRLKEILRKNRHGY